MSLVKWFKAVQAFWNHLLTPFVQLHFELVQASKSTVCTIRSLMWIRVLGKSTLDSSFVSY